MRESSNACLWPCPFDCFSRRSQHCCSNLDSLPISASLVLGKELLDGKVEIDEKKNTKPDGGGEFKTGLKSILKKPVGGAGSDAAVKKGRIRWRDVEGKELAEIREFDNEPREPAMNEDNIPICGCVIL